ncbi:acyl-CoA carboxylase subunit epsilon [Planomonospora parontospora]|uniref:acyl-CoA carboxylase subunit epsilon n=1 Tax=Planomonospora parontospora TaxID=58119 RepID=UPI0016715646|nr:acyl-CoA carboxylase subunit epsilon [Planomonospora parontospora]GGL53505.1 hypothetical protein GCM10014719_63470 [Planomonospora parontospora subsp. antibiotica]GII19612.1 hypothetical protein Ppa05_63380 [Planomonospora parontospora subsp. antibiotica]
MDDRILRVVAGDPTPEELSALICVLYRTAAGRDGEDARVLPPAPRWKPHGYRSPRSWTAGRRVP